MMPGTHLSLTVGLLKAQDDIFNFSFHFHDDDFHYKLQNVWFTMSQQGQTSRSWPASASILGDVYCILRKDKLYIFNFLKKKSLALGRFCNCTGWLSRISFSGISIVRIIITVICRHLIESGNCKDRSLPHCGITWNIVVVKKFNEEHVKVLRMFIMRKILTIQCSI